jgi:type IV pilus assembly protein PilV
MRLQQLVKLNNHGVSLVEVLIALVVLMLVFMGLLQAAILSIDHNVRNLLRDEATKVATSRMEELRSRSFDELESDTGSLAGFDCPTVFPGTGLPFERDVRNIQGFDFCTNMTCLELGDPTVIDGNCATTIDNAQTKRMTIRVGWRWKGENFTHTVTTVRRR